MNNIINNLYNITASSIDKYLQMNGWVRNYNFANKNMMVYTDSYPCERIMAVPASETFDDFYPIVKSTIERLQNIEKRSANEIVKDITTTYIDRLEFRVISKSTEDGKIPLEYAVNCMDGLKKLILYSGCAEQSASPICLRTTKYAKSLLNKFKLTQTEMGSFVLNVDIQVSNENDEQSEECILIPFEHKVITRIGTALNQVDAIVNNQRPLTEMAETAYKNGITANMCDAFRKMRPVSDADKIVATVRYASTLTRQTNQTQQIEMHTNHFLAMDELAKIYRNKIAVQKVNFIGIIRSLSKKVNPDGDFNTAKISAVINGTSYTVTVILSDEQYRAACNTHRDGLEVSVSGELDMNQKHKIMKKVTVFSPAFQK